MNNSRNRSPLRLFQYLPISATFVQCGQRRPSWTMHVNSIISSGTLSGMKRLIDEIRSFKCVSGRESVLVLSWSGNCRRVNSIPLIWLRPLTFSPPKMGYVWSLSREKQQGNTIGSSWPWIVAIGISLNRIRYDLGLIFPSVPSRWVIRITEFHFPMEIEDLYGNRRAWLFLRRWRISEKSLKISDCTLCLWITLIHSEHSGLFLNKGFRALLWNNYESPKEQSRRNNNRTFRLTRKTDQWEFRCSVFTVLQLSVSVQTSWLSRHVFHVHSWSQSLKTYHTLVLVQLTFSSCMLSIVVMVFPFSIFDT